MEIRQAGGGVLRVMMFVPPSGGSEQAQVRIRVQYMYDGGVYRYCTREGGDAAFPLADEPSRSRHSALSAKFRSAQ